MPAKPSRREAMKDGGLAAASIALGLPALSTAEKLSSADTVPIGVIGTGSRGSYLTALLKDVPQARVIACCDILPDHLANGLKSAQPGARGYADYRHLLEDKNIQAVLVATPQFLHFSMARDALHAGKHVYCEKTMTQNVEETRQLVQLVKASKQIFKAGFQERTNPLHQKIKEIIQSGSAGEILHVAAEYSYHTEKQNLDGSQLSRNLNWRMYREYCGGPLAELSAHQIDIVNLILGVRPVKCTGVGKNYFHDGRTNYDQTYVTFEYDTGILGNFTCLMTTAFMGYNIRFYGRKATVEIWNVDGNLARIYFEPIPDDKSGQAEVDAVTRPTRKIFSRGDPVPIEVKGQPEWDTETSTISLQHFVDCVLRNKQPVSTVETGGLAANAVHMGNAAMRSGVTQIWDRGFSLS